MKKARTFLFLTSISLLCLTSCGGATYTEIPDASKADEPLKTVREANNNHTAFTSALLEENYFDETTIRSSTSESNKFNNISVKIGAKYEDSKSCVYFEENFNGGENIIKSYTAYSSADREVMVAFELSEKKNSGTSSIKGKLPISTEGLKSLVIYHLLEDASDPTEQESEISLSLSIYSLEELEKSNLKSEKVYTGSDGTTKVELEITGPSSDSLGLTNESTASLIIDKNGLVNSMEYGSLTKQVEDGVTRYEHSYQLSDAFSYNCSIPTLDFSKYEEKTVDDLSAMKDLLPESD